MTENTRSTAALENGSDSNDKTKEAILGKFGRPDASQFEETRL